jgi:hypothetical protein
MRWDEVDLNGKLWTLPRDRTKSDRAHLVPLSPLALDIITTLPRFAGAPFVFPAQRARRTSELTPAEARAAAHVSGYSKAKMETDRLLAAARQQIRLGDGTTSGERFGRTSRASGCRIASPSSSSATSRGGWRQSTTVGELP